MKTERDLRYDCLRIFAACMVVMTHVSASNWYAVPYSSKEWAVMNLYDSFTRCAVPIFFMLSGAFVLKKEISIKKLYRTKIVPLVVVYIVWAILYAIDTVGLVGLQDVEWTSFIGMVETGKYHLWFLPVLICIYILQPILRAVVKFEEGRFVPYMIIVFFVCGIIKQTILAFGGSHANVSLIMGKLAVDFVGYIGYVILGYFLANQKEIRVKPLRAFGSFVCLSLMATLVGQWDSFRIESTSSILYGDFNIFVFLETILLFLCFQNINTEKISGTRSRNLIQLLASAAMGVYLFHPFVIEKLYFNMGFHTLTFNPLISVPFITGVVCVISFAISLVMIKIPGVKRLWKM